MDFFLCVVVIVGMSLLYDGYTKKKNTEVKLKELELEKRKIDLELKKKVQEHDLIEKKFEK